MVLLNPIKEKKEVFLRNQTDSSSSPTPKISFSKKTRRYGQKNSSSSISSSVTSSPTGTISLVHEPLHFLLPSIPIEERIESYQTKYQSCMESRTELSSWIKKNKAKGLPAPLTEDYRPPVRSRLPEFLQGSLSTKSRRGQLKNNRYESIPTKSSINTFLKKATNYSLRSSCSSTTTTVNHSATTTYNTNSGTNPPAKAKNVRSRINTHMDTPSQKPNTNRFSFTGSLNRFSLTKTSATEMEVKDLQINNVDISSGNSNRLSKSRSAEQSKNNFESQTRRASQLKDDKTNKRPSTSVALEIIGEDADVIPKHSQKSKRLSTPPPKRDLPNATTIFGQSKKSRPQSTIIQSSPSSVFLERLLSRTSYPDVLGVRPNCQAIQPNISPKPNHMHKERLNPISSYSTIPSPTKNDESEMMTEQWCDDRHSRPGFPWKLNGTSSSTIKRTPQSPELKKNRLSMIISPSLSIRLSSQKSHFLRRQSMMS